ncbi:MAG: catalase [Pseudomonadota bacterium]
MRKISILTLCLTLSTTSALADSQFNAGNALDVFEGLFGVTEGKRRNHTKGYCITGEFIPQGEAILEFTNSPIFTGVSKVNGRVSHKGGKPNPADDKPALYGLAFELETEAGDYHIMNMNTEHFFPVANAEDFIKLLKAKIAGAEATKEFAKNSPELQNYKAYHGGLDKSLRPYEGATYNSVNTFLLVDADGKETPVRWAFEPAGEHEIVLEPSESFFLQNIQANLDKGEVAWNMVISLAKDTDDILNPSVKWAEDNTKIVAAKLKVTGAMAEVEGTCDNVNFDPTVLSTGFALSDDPMLQARAEIYATGIGRRLSEK